MLSTAGKNAALDALAALITHVGLSNNGVEIAGGSPAYARQPVAFGAAAAGVVAMTGTETFNCPAAAVVNQVDFMSALTVGTSYGDAVLVQETFGGQGIYILDTLTITLSDP